MVALNTFRSLPVAAGHATNVLVGGGLIVAMASVPLFTNVVLGDSPLMGGLNLMRMTVMLPIGALLGGILSGWVGFHRTTVAGMAMCGAGFLLMSTWPADVGQWHMTLPLLLAGLGFGLVIAPIGTAVVNAVGENQRATVSALLQVARLIGMLVGIALLTSRGLGRFYERAAGIALDDPSYRKLVTEFEVTTFSETFVVTALVCFLGVLPALWLGRGLARRLTWREIWPLS
jgi:MFS family permease